MFNITRRCSLKLCLRVLITSVIAVLPLVLLAVLSRTADTDRFLLYDCTFLPCGGWADRLEGITSAFLLAQATGRRFGIDCSLPRRLEYFLQPSRHNWLIDQQQLKAYNSDKLYNYKNDLAVIQSHEHLDFDAHHPEQVVRLKLNAINWPFLRRNGRYAERLEEFSNISVGEVFAKVHNSLFSPSAELDQRLERFRQSARPTSDHRLICAHIRTGSFLFESFNPHYNFANATDVNAILDFFQSSLDEPTRFFVATDSPSVIRRAARRFGSNLVRISGPIKHTERSTKGNVIGGFWRTLADFYALSTCDVLVLSDSCFSSLTAFLRGKDDGLYAVVDHKVVKVDRAFVEKQYHRRVLM